MEKFILHVTKSYKADIEVEAENREEAIEKAWDLDLENDMLTFIFSDAYVDFDIN